MLRNLGVWIVESLNKRVNYTKAYQYEKNQIIIVVFFLKKLNYTLILLFYWLFSKKRGIFCKN